MSIIQFSSSKHQMFEYRNLDYITSSVVDPIVINTWYVALAPTRNVKAWYLIIEQTNDGAAVETIEVELTIDDIVYTDTLAGVASGAINYMTFDTDGVFGTTGATIGQLLSLDADQSAPLETRSLGIRVRQTTAVDATGATIEVNMVYETKESA